MMIVCPHSRLGGRVQRRAIRASSGDGFGCATANSEMVAEGAAKLGLAATEGRMPAGCRAVHNGQ